LAYPRTVQGYGLGTNDQRSSAAWRIATATARAIEPGRLRFREGEPAANTGSAAGRDLAGISVDWYVRLEQGRESLPSKATVEALAKALRPSSTERAHVLRLALGGTGRIFKREMVPSHVWEEEARDALESFRVTYDLWSHSPQFNALVDELNAASPEFARWWRAHEIRPKPSGTKVMTHPTLGRVRLAYSTFQANDNLDLRLVIYGDMTRKRH
jgi:MmyB-like transcription regulator ligand binding domain/Helix-turn-helix domain